MSDRRRVSSTNLLGEPSLSWAKQLRRNGKTKTQCEMQMDREKPDSHETTCRYVHLLKISVGGRVCVSARRRADLRRMHPNVNGARFGGTRCEAVDCPVGVQALCGDGGGAARNARVKARRDTEHQTRESRLEHEVAASDENLAGSRGER